MSTSYRQEINQVARNSSGWELAKAPEGYLKGLRKDELRDFNYREELEYKRKIEILQDQIDNLRTRLQIAEAKVDKVVEDNYLWEIADGLGRLERIVEGEHLYSCTRDSYCRCAKRVLSELMEEIES